MSGNSNDAAQPVTFRTQAAWKHWLAKHHRTNAALVVRIYKAHAADLGLTYAQALDEALCVGWIDGVRRRLDADSFSIRFTPRKPRSIWSNINVRHVQRLKKEGRMHEAGLAAFDKKADARTGIYAFEQDNVELAPTYLKALRANAAAWAYFQARPPWYRRTTSHWVMRAKKEETRARRLATLIDCCARQTTIGPLTPAR